MRMTRQERTDLATVRRMAAHAGWSFRSNVLAAVIDADLEDLERRFRRYRTVPTPAMQSAARGVTDAMERMQAACAAARRAMQTLELARRDGANLCDDGHLSLWRRA